MPTKLVALPSKAQSAAKKRSAYPTLSLTQHLDLLSAHISVGSPFNWRRLRDC